MNSDATLNLDRDGEPLSVDVSHLITEDDAPVDNAFSEKQMRLLTHPLYASWNPGVPFVAMANVGLFFALNAPPLVPDALLSLGVSAPEDLKPKDHGAYFYWIYGKAPDVVVEIVSNKEGGELTRKKERYASFAVPYYVVFDPCRLVQEVRLQAFALVHTGFKARYEPMAEARFPEVGLGLREWDGEFEQARDRWIRWADLDGRLIQTGEERAAVLAQRLRELGVDPDSV